MTIAQYQQDIVEISSKYFDKKHTILNYHFFSLGIDYRIPKIKLNLTKNTDLINYYKYSDEKINLATFFDFISRNVLNN